MTSLGPRRRSNRAVPTLPEVPVTTRRMPPQCPDVAPVNRAARSRASHDGIRGVERHRREGRQAREAANLAQGQLVVMIAGGRHHAEALKTEVADVITTMGCAGRLSLATTPAKDACG